MWSYSHNARSRIHCIGLLDARIYLAAMWQIWINQNLILLPNILDGTEKQLWVWWTELRLLVGPLGQIFTHDQRRVSFICDVSNKLYASLASMKVDLPPYLLGLGELWLSWALWDNSQEIHTASLTDASIT